MTIPYPLDERQQWLVWRFESQPGDKKPRKVPYYVNGKRRHGAQGTPDDRAQLARHDAAVAAMSRGGFDGTGFAFLPDDGLAGIDLDKVIDPDTGEVAERAVNIVKACASYTELSPSKTGLHIFVATDLVGAFKSFKNNSIGVEVFCGAQFFTWTGEQWSGTPELIAPLDEKTLARLRATVRGKKPAAATGSSSHAPLADDEERRAEAALVYVGADEYQTWIDLGMALKQGFGEAGYAIWDRWSARSAKYPGADETRRRWGTFNPNGALTLGTLFELAKRGGWSPPRRAKRPLSKKNPDQGAEHPDGGPPGEAPPPEGNAGPPGGDSRPVIKWTQGKLPECVDQAEDALLKSGMRIYQRAGFLVRVVRRDTPSVRHYKRRPPGALGIKQVDIHYLIEAFTRAARWLKWNATKEGWVPTNAPEQAASTYLARGGHWQLPRLWSAISAPTLRPDGTVLQEPGYDTLTESWYDPCGIEFPRIPEAPTHEDAMKALKVFGGAFDSFPFDNPSDKAVALALALTALVRRSVPSAPLGAITAPVMASGKTLIADCIAILATGVSAPAMKYADTDEEATKTMLAILSEGDQVVLIDNVERPLQGSELCAVMTSETYRQRVLGKTEMMSVPTTTLWLATGNHLVIQGDLRTRALLCRIDPKTERPEQRQFEGEKREWMTQHRPELVAAGLTIMRAFIATGQDPKDHCNTWGRFERWSDMVRAPLMWLGCEDPCASLKDLEKEDPERGELLRVLTAWEHCFGDEGYTAAEAIERAATSDPLNLALREICKERDGTLNPKRLGQWLRKHSDRLVSDTSEPPHGVTKKPSPPRRFVRAGEKNHTLLWKVETMKPS